MFYDLDTRELLRTDPSDSPPPRSAGPPTAHVPACILTCVAVSEVGGWVWSANLCTAMRYLSL